MKKALFLLSIIALSSCTKQNTVTLKEAVEQESFDTLKVKVLIIGEDTLNGTINIKDIDTY